MGATIEEQIALVQCYIHHLKGVEVNINLLSAYARLDLLDRAYQSALSYFTRV